MTRSATVLSALFSLIQIYHRESFIRRGLLSDLEQGQLSLVLNRLKQNLLNFLHLRSVQY
jgi:hypothetical protein